MASQSGKVQRVVVSKTPGVDVSSSFKEFANFYVELDVAICGRDKGWSFYTQVHKHSCEARIGIR